MSAARLENDPPPSSARPVLGLDDAMPMSVRHPPVARRSAQKRARPPTSASATERPTFDRRTAGILVALSGVSLGAALLYRAFGDELREEHSDGADAFSRSAIGHRALVESLARSDIDAVVSRFASAKKASADVALVLAEPIYLRPGDEGPSGVPLTQGIAALVRGALDAGAPVLLVLPKWQGVPDPSHEGWVERVDLVPASTTIHTLTLAAGIADRAELVVRLGAPATSWSRSSLTAELPTLPHPQLLDPASGLEPLIWTDEGILIGRVPGGPSGHASLFVLSDPDLVNNAGLGRGENAELVERVVREALEARALVIDETLHGFGRPPSLWADLLRFPLLIATLHVLGLLALAVWMLVGRFGKPKPLPPRVAPGKEAIVESTTDLLESGRAHGALGRYLRLRMRHAAGRVGVPAGLPEGQLWSRLAAIARSRGMKQSLSDLVADADAHEKRVGVRELLLARRIHRFCEEIAHGHR